MLASLKRRLDSRLEPECKIDGSIWRMSTEEAGNIQVNFGRHRFQTLSSGSLLKLSQTEAWRNNANVLKGKLVLLGGSFRASRDTHNTPVGRKDGIEILAHSVDTLLPGGRLTRLSDSGFFWIELAVGVILLLPAYYLPRGWSLAILACALPVIAFLASYAAFQIFGYFGSFVPVLAGVFFHEMIEHYLEYHQALATAAGKRR
jgi:CHASE2 domain-containing sensor protein